MTNIQRRTYPATFLIGALVLYIGLFAVPSVLGFYYSFTDWSAFSSHMHFVGLRNFKTVFSSSERYLFFVSNTLEFTIVTTAAKTILALAVALLLQNGVVLKSAHRAILFTPAVLSFLITGIVFKSILHPSKGFLNTTLNHIGLPMLAERWLVDPHFAFWSVMAVDTWKGVGYLMVIFLAGLHTIPQHHYDSAQIDGAGAFKRFWFITLPLLMPSMVVVVVLNVLYGLRVFDVVYVLTNGGPGHLTEVLNTVVFERFSEGAYGLATAVSTVLFVVMAIVGIVLIRLMNRRIVDLS